MKREGTVSLRTVPRVSPCESPEDDEAKAILATMWPCILCDALTKHRQLQSRTCNENTGSVLMLQ